MKLAVLAFSSLICFTAQTVLIGPGGGGLPARPDILVILVFVWGIVLGPTQAIIAGAIAGVLQECVSAAPAGTQLLAFVPVVLLSGVRRVEVIEHPLALAMVMSPFTTAIYAGITALCLATAGWQVEWVGNLVGVIAPTALSNFFLTPFFYLLVVMAVEVFGFTRPGGGVPRHLGQD
ncbi:MAG: rod shape-determining protein MreD [Chloroflexota bacterium]